MGLLRAIENLVIVIDFDIEFIFVVDGSTDGSLELLQEFKVSH